MVSPYQISFCNGEDENEALDQCSELENVNMVSRCCILESHGNTLKNMAKEMKKIKNKLKSNIIEKFSKWEIEYEDVNETINNL